MGGLTLSFAVQTHRVQFVVPSELIKKNIKTIQRQIEKSKKLVTEEIAKVKENTLLSPEQKLGAVKRLVKVYDQFHKRLTAAVERDQDYRLRLFHRAQRLNELKKYTVGMRDGSFCESRSPVEGDEEVLDLHSENLIGWYKDETNLLIVDYLLKSNTKREANLGLEILQKLDRHSSVPFSMLVDHDVYTNYNKVFISISENHDLEPVSTWYADNRTALKKFGSNLLFEIHYCKYLSLIEDHEPLEAIAYSKKNLAPYARRENYGAVEDSFYEENLRRLIQLGSPLVCVSLSGAKPENGVTRPQSRASSIVSSFLSRLAAPATAQLEAYTEHQTEEHWRRLAHCFTRDSANVYGIPQTYPLFVHLSAGLSSLKTKSCFCNRENTVFQADKSGNLLDHLDSNSLRDLSLRGPNQYYKLLKKINQCPVCSPELYALSLNLPYGQLITSIYNNPFRLPNGNIYPFDKLLTPEGNSERTNLVRNGKIFDPLTHEVFFIDDCIRVFPA